MKSQTFELKLLTRTFSGGVTGAQGAEIRAPSIRGQLRWWFRVLGGFRPFAGSPSLDAKMLEDDEAEIFGTAAGQRGTASKLAIRVLPIRRSLPCSDFKLGKAGVQQNPDHAYLLWPMAQKIRDEQGAERENIRGFLPAGAFFAMRVDWRGDPKLWDDVLALVTVFGNLGALGYRGRRAQGALAFAQKGPASLPNALARFPNRAARLAIQELGPATDAGNAAKQLADWLKKWREHGQQDRFWTWHDKKNHSLGGFWTGVSNKAAFTQAGFPFARRDHNEGLKQLVGSYPPSDPVKPEGNSGTTFRSTLGLPIVQRFSSLGNSNGPLAGNATTVTWSRTAVGESRFASPVILRPHLDDTGQWRALVLFVDCYAWNPADPVYLNGAKKNVSLELYKEMKKSVPNTYP